MQRSYRAVPTLGLAALAALALAAPRTARASVIVTNVNQNIGTETGDLSSYTLAALPGTPLSLYVGNYGGNYIQIAGADDIADKDDQGYHSPEELKSGLSVQGALASAQDLDQESDIDIDVNGSFQGTFPPSYIAFDFTAPGGQTDYGYLYGTETRADGGANGGNGALTYDLISYGYDTTGADIETGAPASPAPEPSQFGVMALLGLGLTGLIARARRRQTAA